VQKYKVGVNLLPRRDRGLEYRTEGHLSGGISSGEIPQAWALKWCLHPEYVGENGKSEAVGAKGRFLTIR